MEKRFTLALILSLVVLVVYTTWFTPKPVPKKPGPPTPEVEQPGESGREPPRGDVPPPTPRTVPDPEDGPQETAVLKNDKLRLTFSNKGAVLTLAELLDFKPRASSPDGEALKLLVPSPSGLDSMRLDDLSHPELGLADRVWKMERGGDGRQLTFTRDFQRQSTGGASVTYTLRKVFTLPAGDAPYVHVVIEWLYTDAEPGSELRNSFALRLSEGVFQEESGEVMSPPRSVLHPFEDEVTVVTVQEVDKEPAGEEILAALAKGDAVGVKRRLGSGHRFIADVSNYHGAFLVLHQFPEALTAVVQPVVPKGDERHDAGSLGRRTATMLTFNTRVTQGEANKQVFAGLLYLGPVEDRIIREALTGVDGIADDEIEVLGEVYDSQLGWARPIARLVLGALRALHGLVGNWGWAIVLLTFCVRVLLFPINRKSQAAMMRQQEAMAKVKPKLEALKEKHKGDSRKFAEAQMRLFKEEKVPLVPIGGCLPIFLQIPVFFGLFAALRASIDLRQASWLWVADLSQPDHFIRFDNPVYNPMSFCSGCCGTPAPDITGLHILPILMTVAWVLNSYLMPRPETTNPQMEQQRKMMMFMPLLFGLMMYSYAAGLSLYWLTSSVVGIIETRIIKKVWPLKKA